MQQPLSTHQALRKDGLCVGGACTCRSIRLARGKPLDGDNAHPFPDFYTYFRHYCAFYVAINSFSIALKFLKGILNTWRGAVAILISFTVNKTSYHIVQPFRLSNSCLKRCATLPRKEGNMRKKYAQSGVISECKLLCYLQTSLLSQIFLIDVEDEEVFLCCILCFY